MTTPPPEVLRWYTRARKFPQVIGRTPDGARIWGGPYTITQAVTGGLLLLLGYHTMSVWARFGFFGNVVVLLGATYGVVVLIGRIPVGARNPLTVVAGAVRAACAPRTGRLAGRPVRLRAPHRVRHSITVQTGAPPAPDPTPAPRSPRATVRVPPRPPALTGVQLILARAGGVCRPEGD